MQHLKIKYAFFDLTFKLDVSSINYDSINIAIIKPKNPSDKIQKNQTPNSTEFVLKFGI